MNKIKLIEDMAKVSSLPKTTCKKALESFMTVVENTLKSGESIVLTGFGTFTVVKRSSRTGVNPATGKKMQIPAKKVVKFKAGKIMKEMIAKSK
jgi:DNA-binding protein HU-beta